MYIQNDVEDNNERDWNCSDFVWFGQGLEEALKIHPEAT